MTTHVVCVDGTKQVKIQACPTNIAHLFDALGGQSQDVGDGSFESSGGPHGAHGKYLSGVGARGSLALRALGNLFGNGIAEPIVRGYTFLSRMHEPGDKILIIGFSRGATAARALAGWVVVRGLLDRTQYDSSNKEAAYHRAIAAWYTYRGNRRDLADPTRLDFLGDLLGTLAPLGDDAFTPPVEVDAVGVFDTVSSLGVPHLDFAGNAVFDFSICDTTLNPRVKRGFHALAADEVRELFAPTFWAARDAVEQEIFPGCHSDVGGGYAERALSDCALHWMIAKLNGVQQLFEVALLGAAFNPAADAPAHDESRVFPFFATPQRARAFPHVAAPSATLQQRRGKTTATLPGTNTGQYQPTGRYADGSAI